MKVVLLRHAWHFKDGRAGAGGSTYYVNDAEADDLEKQAEGKIVREATEGELTAMRAAGQRLPGGEAPNWDLVAEEALKKAAEAAAGDMQQAHAAGEPA